MVQSDQKGSKICPEGLKNHQMRSRSMLCGDSSAISKNLQKTPVFTVFLSPRAVQERPENGPRDAHVAMLLAQKRPGGRQEASQTASSENRPKKNPKRAPKSGPKRPRNQLETRSETAPKMVLRGGLERARTVCKSRWKPDRLGAPRLSKYALM